MEPVVGMQIAPIEQVRAQIARLILGEQDNQHTAIGRIELRPHQRTAVLRLRESLREFDGGLLCDPVGTGKTFIALAVPPPDARLIVVAPAILTDMWHRALAIVDRKADFISFESLSRGSRPDGKYDFVIVDEAHHARNPKTVRYALLAELVSQSQVLFLTATPIHNRRSDLVALISLFLGERAASLTSSELTRCVIRRDALKTAIRGMPEVETLTWINLRDNDRIPDALVALPPPLPPRDGGDGGVLITRSLIRQWASSDAALMGGLRRRIVRAEALIAALSDGTWPTRDELLSWISGDDSIQLGLPGFLASPSPATSELLDVVERHLNGLKKVFELVQPSSADAERTSFIEEVRRIHPERSIVAFSEYADTVSGFFTKLVNDGKVCALTASRARVAGGTISRADAIRQFAPSANGCKRPTEAEAITLLLTTDLLSEGVNLQDAGIVVHLDLPWTPARMEQRLGRVARIGSQYERIPSYAFRPPASGDAVVRIERILREKLRAAGIVVPVTPFLSGMYEQAGESTLPQRNEAIRSLILQWRDGSREVHRCLPLVAGINSDRNGFIAVTQLDGKIRILARSRALIGDSVDMILDVLQHCGGREVHLSPDEITSCERDVISWFESDEALHIPRSAQHTTNSIRSVAIKRVHQILRDARTHERARLAEKSERAITSLSLNFGVFVELQIRRLCDDAINGERFIDRVIELTGQKLRSESSMTKLLALIVLVQR